MEVTTDCIIDKTLLCLWLTASLILEHNVIIPPAFYLSTDTIHQSNANLYMLPTRALRLTHSPMAKHNDHSLKRELGSADPT